jgi:hypothetical protein
LHGGPQVAGQVLRSAHAMSSTSDTRPRNTTANTSVKSAIAGSGRARVSGSAITVDSGRLWMSGRRRANPAVGGGAPTDVRQRRKAGPITVSQPLVAPPKPTQASEAMSITKRYFTSLFSMRS